jgi:hypothetical protein
MLINISGIYLEVGIKFKVSWKVDKLIMGKLSELDLQSTDKSKLKNREYIGFLITTTKDSHDIIINGPRFRRRSKFIDFSVTLPFLEYFTEDYLNKYLNSLEEALIMGFNKLEIKDKRINDVFKMVKEEITGNENYKYIE